MDSFATWLNTTSGIVVTVALALIVLAVVGGALRRGKRDDYSRGGGSTITQTGNNQTIEIGATKTELKTNVVNNFQQAPAVAASRDGATTMGLYAIGGGAISVLYLSHLDVAILVVAIATVLLAGVVVLVGLRARAASPERRKTITWALMQGVVPLLALIAAVVLIGSVRFDGRTVRDIAAGVHGGALVTMVEQMVGQFGVDTLYFVLMQAGGLVILLLGGAVSVVRLVRLDVGERANGLLAKLAVPADARSSMRGALFSLIPIALALLLVSGALAQLLAHVTAVPLPR